MIKEVRGTLVIGNKTFKAHQLRMNLEKDIAFLKERIAQFRQKLIPNSTSLETYQDMLKSRETILEWLNKRVSMSD